MSMCLPELAQETLAILEQGAYTTPSLARVDLAAWQQAAESGTRLYSPVALAELLARSGRGRGRPAITVTGERTQEAARRLVQDEGASDLVLLNFASARNPGGGFLRGARAQEEDLCRSSGLYRCLLTQPAYYAANRENRSLLYTDHAIWSPGVPFFRAQGLELLERPFAASVITAPAPNAGELIRHEPAGSAPALEVEIDATLRRRAGMVLAIAEAHGHRSLLLGAWGCGAFGNHPVRAAAAFGEWLQGERFAGAFDRVVFGVFDSSPARPNLGAFRARFG